MNRHNPMPMRRRGVSLVEALMAMAIMAFGMLAVVGVQSTMRLNSDIAKQRSEATRLAELNLEALRSFTTVGEFDNIASAGTVAIAGPEFNTTYQLTRTVNPEKEDGVVRSSIAVSIVVKWSDRNNQEQSVKLHDVLSRVDPVLSGMAVAAKPLSALGRRLNRHPTIPLDAQDFTGSDAGKSIFKPSASDGTAWVFNNATGVIEYECTGILTLPTTLPGTCTKLPNGGGHLLAGEVRFNLRGTAHDLGSESVMKPIPGDNVAWVINNSTKKIARTCTVSTGSTTQTLTSDDIIAGPGCTTQGIAVAPFDAADESYDLVASDSQDPTWPAVPFELVVNTTDSLRTPTCFSAASNLGKTVLTLQKVPYFCLVKMDADQKWSGTAKLKPLGYLGASSPAWSIGTTATQYLVCRYTQVKSDTTANADHPKVYSDVVGNLVNQNFLLINGAKACPEDDPANPLSGDLVNSNTFLHQSS
jgi:Tfp pilus assembly protein PilV